MSASSPPSVIKAYYKQFESDFSTFLKCRSEELVKGGMMVLTTMGRKSEDPSSKDGCHIWDLLAMTLNDLVAKGLVEEEKLNSFNIPKYTPSPTEIKVLVEKNGAFTINCLEVSQIYWTEFDNDNINNNNEKNNNVGYNVARCVRAVAEPMLVSHFGEGIMEDVFHRNREIIADSMSKEKTQFINVVVSLIRK
nr:salicylate carboxymethyltransferase-like [Ipomoea batatas]